MTAAAAVEPALRAGRISPVAALRLRLDQGAILRARLRWLLLVFAVVGLVGLLLWPGAAAGRQRPRAPAGRLRPPARDHARRPLRGRAARAGSSGLAAAPFLPAEARLTRGALTRDRSRTALTVGALAVAIAVLVALAGVAGSTREAATSWLATWSRASFCSPRSGRSRRTSRPPTEIAALPGVARVSPHGPLLGGRRRDADGRRRRRGRRPAGGRRADPRRGRPGAGVRGARRGRRGDRAPQRGRAQRARRGVAGSRSCPGPARWSWRSSAIAERTIPGTVGGGDPRRLAGRDGAPRRPRRRRLRRPLRAGPGGRRPAGRRGGRPGPMPSSRRRWTRRPGRSAPRSTAAPSCSPRWPRSPCSSPPWASSTRSR